MSIVVKRRCEETSWRRNVYGIGEYVPVCKDDLKRNVKPFERAVDEVVDMRRTSKYRFPRCYALHSSAKRV
jgi:hypothetical protein